MLLQRLQQTWTSALSRIDALLFTQAKNKPADKEWAPIPLLHIWFEWRLNATPVSLFLHDINYISFLKKCWYSYYHHDSRGAGPYLNLDCILVTVWAALRRVKDADFRGFNDWAHLQEEVDLTWKKLSPLVGEISYRKEFATFVSKFFHIRDAPLVKMASKLCLPLVRYFSKFVVDLSNHYQSRLTV